MAKKDKQKSPFYRGARGFQEKENEDERIANRKYDFRRFFLNKDKPEAEVVILDEKMDDLFMLREHAIPGPGMNWSQVQHISCGAEFDECHICNLAADGDDARFNQPYFCMAITILDLTPWESKDGSKSGDFTRCILIVKRSQMQSFIDAMEICEEENGTIRGMVLQLRRDLKDKNSSSIGEITPYKKTGKIFDFMDEDELFEYGNEEETGSKGQVIKEEDEDISVVDYEEEFAIPDMDTLKKSFRAKGGGSNKDDDDSEWQSSRRRNRRSRSRDDDDDDKPKSRTRTRRRSRDDDDDNDDKGSSRTRTRRRKPADDDGDDEAPRTRTRRRKPVDDDDGEAKKKKKKKKKDKGGDDEAPARTRTRRRSRGDDDDDKPPVRRRGGGRGRDAVI